MRGSKTVSRLRAMAGRGSKVEGFFDPCIVLYLHNDTTEAVGKIYQRISKRYHVIPPAVTHSILYIETHEWQCPHDTVLRQASVLPCLGMQIVLCVSKID